MINLQEHQRRRAQLLEAMGADAVAVLAAASEKTRSGDSVYPYRQDSDFYYLTGFNEPESVAFFLPKRKEGEFVLFCRERDPASEQWTGPRAGTKGVCEQFGVDEAFAIEKLDDLAEELLKGRKKLYWPMGSNKAFQEKILSWLKNLQAKVRAGVDMPQQLMDLGAIVHEQRLIKSKAEIERMRQAAQISVDAHLRGMKVCRPGLKEYQLEGEMLHEFVDQGSRTPAYETIVGSGANSCVLHYVQNNEVLKEGDLVLIDGAAECDYYAADVTRTFPVNGKFSPEQKAIYEIVLKAQLAVLEKVRPGTLWNDLQTTAVKIITEGLLNLGILKGKLKDLIEQKAYQPFYMHNIGHWLGLDVHDVGRYKVEGKWRALEPGMVLTVEPGIYISGNNADVDKKWWNIGVRIEDDVLVTSEGHEVLSAGLPKQIKEIEHLIGSK